MNNTQALAIIDAAKTAFQTAKAQNAKAQADLAALRDRLASHDTVVQTLNDQIDSLIAADREIDEALEGLASVTTPDDSSTGVTDTGTIGSRDPAADPAESAAESAESAPAPEASVPSEDPANPEA